MSVIADVFKAKVAIKAALAFLEQLSAAIDLEDDKAVGAALFHLGRELRTAKRLLEGE